MLRNINSWIGTRNGVPVIIALLLMSLIFASCGRSVKFDDLSQVAQQVVASDDGVFRGVDFDMDIDEVTIIETADLIETDSRYLYYEALFDNAVYSEIEYLFDANGNLDRIICNLHIDSTGLSDSLFEELAAYYDTRFGSRQKNLNDFKFWEFSNNKISNGKIELSLYQVKEGNSSHINIEFYHRLTDDEEDLAT